MGGPAGGIAATSGHEHDAVLRAPAQDGWNEPGESVVHKPGNSSTAPLLATRPRGGMDDHVRWYLFAASLCRPPEFRHQLPCPPSRSHIIFFHGGFDPAGVSIYLGRRTTHTYSISIVRKPLARLVSFANFQGVPTAEFEKGGWRRYAGNYQAVALSGANFESPLVPESLTNACAQWPKELVATAKQNVMDKFAFVGVTERFAQSTWLMQHILGWGEDVILTAVLKPVRHFTMSTSKNQTRIAFNASQLSPHTVAAIHAEEACDSQLWAFVDALLDAQISALTPDEKDQLMRFEARAAAGKFIERSKAQLRRLVPT